MSRTPGELWLGSFQLRTTIVLLSRGVLAKVPFGLSLCLHALSKYLNPTARCRNLAIVLLRVRLLLGKVFVAC